MARLIQGQCAVSLPPETLRSAGGRDEGVEWYNQRAAYPILPLVVISSALSPSRLQEWVWVYSARKNCKSMIQFSLVGKSNVMDLPIEEQSSCREEIWENQILSRDNILSAYLGRLRPHSILVHTNNTTEYLRNKMSLSWLEPFVLTINSLTPQRGSSTTAKPTRAMISSNTCIIGKHMPYGTLYCNYVALVWKCSSVYIPIVYYCCTEEYCSTIAYKKNTVFKQSCCNKCP